jgi:hypothetical protein
MFQKPCVVISLVGSFLFVACGASDEPAAAVDESQAALKRAHGKHC